MSKSIKKLKRNERKMIKDALFSTAEAMDANGAVTKFIQELLTESEQIIIGRRILIAQMILAGKKQAEVSYELNVSPNTFARTRKWLDKQLPHYDDALKEYEKKLAARKLAAKKKTSNRSMRTRGIDPFSYEALRHKYPAHFLLFNIAEELLKK